nr:unnamed protein product [Digitaria exilis]
MWFNLLMILYNLTMMTALMLSVVRGGSSWSSLCILSSTSSKSSSSSTVAALLSWCSWMMVPMNASISSRCFLNRRGVELSIIASRDDGKISGRVCVGNLSRSSSSLRNVSLSLNLLPMMARTDASATYADTIWLRFTGDGEASAAAAADTETRRRRTSSSRTALKDRTRRALRSSVLAPPVAVGREDDAAAVLAEQELARGAEGTRREGEVVAAHDLARRVGRGGDQGGDLAEVEKHERAEA